MGVTVTLLIALALVSSPKTTVTHFLQPASPGDLCAQLTPRYRKALDRQYGPCLQTVGQNEKVTGLRFVRAHTGTTRATVEVRYLFRGRRYQERFNLVRLSGRWRIDNAALLG